MNRRSFLPSIFGGGAVAALAAAATKPDPARIALARHMRQFDTGKPDGYSDEEWEVQLAARAKGLHVVRFWYESRQIAPAVEKKIGEDFACRIRLGNTLYKICGYVVATDNPGLHRCSASVLFEDGVRMAAVSEDPGVEIFLFHELRRVTSPTHHPPLGSW